MKKMNYAIVLKTSGKKEAMNFSVPISLLNHSVPTFDLVEKKTHTKICIVPKQETRGYINN